MSSILVSFKCQLGAFKVCTNSPYSFSTLTESTSAAFFLSFWKRQLNELCRMEIVMKKLPIDYRCTTFSLQWSNNSHIRYVKYFTVQQWHRAAERFTCLACKWTFIMATLRVYIHAVYASGFNFNFPCTYKRIYIHCSDNRIFDYTIHFTFSIRRIERGGREWLTNMEFMRCATWWMMMFYGDFLIWDFECY